MNQMGGLFELIIVFAIVLGWGFIELRALRLDKKKLDDSKRRDGDQLH